MNRHLFRTLQGLSAFFAFLLFFPAEALLLQLPPRLFRGSWGTLTPRDGMIGFAALFVVSLTGRGCADLLDRKCGFPPLRRRLLTGLVGGLGAAAAALGLMRVFPRYESVVWGGLAFFAFVVGGELRGVRYGELIGLRLYVITAGVYLATLLILTWANANTLTAQPFAVLMLAETVILLLGMNQSGLDVMMERRRHRADQLPRRIRSYNLRLVGGVAAGLVAIPLLYRPVAAAVRAIGRGLLAALKQVIRLINRLLSMGADDPVPDLPVSSTPVEEPQLPTEPAVSSPFWDYLGYLILALLALYILYNSKRIFRFVAKWIRKIRDAIRAWLSRPSRMVTPADDEAYVDTDEPLPDVPRDAPEVPTAWAQWRRQYRRFRAMPAGEARQCAGYRLATEWYRIQGVPVSPADTPLEQADKARDTLDFADPAAATDEYDAMHYGACPCPAQALDALLAAMAQTKTPLRYSNLTRPRKEIPR